MAAVFNCDDCGGYTEDPEVVLAHEKRNPTHIMYPAPDLSANAEFKIA